VAIRGAAARRYAQAAFEIARDNKNLERWLSDLKTLSGVFGSPEVVSLIEDPKLTEDDQRKIIARLLEPGLVSELPMNLLHLLVRRNRLSALPRMVEVFQELYNKEKGIVIAEVTTAVPLSDEQGRKVADHLSQVTGKTVNLRLRHDPGILGGMITRIGDEVIDASVASRLAALSERIT
jgi:F-type H+-transporting ATPase subunit delta